MKHFKIISAVFALVLFAFAANAQSCCSESETKKEPCCLKPETQSNTTAEVMGAKVVLVAARAITYTGEKTFKVYGNCGMCKKRIEGTLNGVEGVHSAIWDKETKMLTISFNEQTITLAQIHQKITAVGHDTDKYRADQSVYEGLPGCCQYERAKI